ncbi:mitogen-activated protein kinase kinase [Ranunculus cassubicifolius]
MEVLATVGATAVTNIATNAATNCCITRIMNFRENHELLRVKVSELQAFKDHVNRRIIVAEDSGLTRTPVVTEWLVRVEEITQEAILILEEGSRQIEQSCCFVGCYPVNWWTRYILGKRMSMILTTVVELCGKGSFDIVADNSSPNPVQVLPESQAVGLEELFAKVWKLLGEDEVKIMGIYGMGGVGKTTLLKKLNNAYSKEADKFDVVIWAVVSKEFSIGNVQKEIGRRLGFDQKEEEDETEKAERIFNALRKKKFVVMLDDLWEPLDLEAIGIPHTNHNNSKIIITTRSEDVCGRMECDRKVKVPVLDWGQSWILFQSKVGQEALRSHPEIPNLAQQVARECCGLPLALITIARAMTTKKTPPEWKHAINILKKYASEFSGMEDKVLATLKFSYDNLENDTARHCFLYFSLYPEDSNIGIGEIIYHWIGEGFLDDLEDMDDAIDHGHAIIGSLKAACLLETGYNEESEVKMHDVVRDLALWICRECGKKRSKYLVQAGIGLSQVPSIQTWKREAERISLMDNDIKELSNAPECPNLLTLLVQGNQFLATIATDFFQCMPLLSVLNLSRAKISDVPRSIGSLTQLQFLDLSSTRISTLPQELGNLVELRYLNLSWTKSLYFIPGGMISCFTRLQFLDLYESGTSIIFQVPPSVEDLQSLAHINDLRIIVHEFQMLSSMLLSKNLSSCLTKLTIRWCLSLTKLALAPLSSIFGNLKKLYELKILECVEMEELEINSGTEDNNMRLLMSLERLELSYLETMKITWSETSTSMHFQNLSYIHIDYCDVLRDLSWLILVPSLKDLKIGYCKEVEEILLGEFPRTSVDIQTFFSSLKSLELHGLPKLKSICQLMLPFPSLEHITVMGCPFLKKLPFASSSTKKPLLYIVCNEDWWDSLQWEDQTSKSSFQPFVSFMWVQSHLHTLECRLLKVCEEVTA